MKNLLSFSVGLIFAWGLGLSGMTKPQVVKGFLDFFGNWNYNLLGVMGGAILIHSLLFYFIRKRERPVLDSKFYLPTSSSLDKRLFFGAALFGLGWGWAGICPGPGIVGLASGESPFFIFIASMIIGMILFKWVNMKFL